VPSFWQTQSTHRARRIQVRITDSTSTPAALCVGTIVKVNTQHQTNHQQKVMLEIEYDGVRVEGKPVVVTVDIDDPAVHYRDYGKKIGKKLTVAVEGMINESFDWDTYLSKTNSKAVTDELAGSLLSHLVFLDPTWFTREVEKILYFFGFY
jgi:hypothetical protein